MNVWRDAPTLRARRCGCHSLQEIRSGYVDQVQTNVLELAGNFLLQTREGARECAVP